MRSGLRRRRREGAAESAVVGAYVLSWARPDCVAGVGGLELRNVVANYPFERSHRFPGIQPNSGRRDCSRLSCDGGRRSSGLVSRGRMLALAGIVSTPPTIMSPEAPSVGQRCAGLAPSSADRKHSHPCAPRRPPSPLHQSLGFWYTHLLTQGNALFCAESCLRCAR